MLIQEFNTGVPARQWVNGTFGNGFHFFREEGKQIPNGVISRFSIIRSGVWDDPVLDNREFAWALLGLPGKRELWVVSVHPHAKSGDSRARQAAALAEIIRRNVPEGALLVIGGDFNTRTVDEPCLTRLTRVVAMPAKTPDDGLGNITTNAPRNRPYDWVLANPPLDRHAVPVVLAGKEFPHGLVFDSRIFEPLDRVPPVRRGDSGVPFMQHLAVVRDFRIPRNKTDFPKPAFDKSGPPSHADARDRRALSPDPLMFVPVRSGNRPPPEHDRAQNGGENRRTRIDFPACGNGGTDPGDGTFFS